MALDLHDMDIGVMARRLLYDLVASDYAGERWETYPDLGEDDWQAVLERAKELVGDLNPEADTYAAVYERLARRAERPAPYDEAEVVETY